MLSPSETSLPSGSRSLPESGSSTTGLSPTELIWSPLTEASSSGSLCSIRVKAEPSAFIVRRTLSLAETTWTDPSLPTAIVPSLTPSVVGSAASGEKLGSDLGSVVQTFPAFESMSPIVPPPSPTPSTVPSCCSVPMRDLAGSTVASVPASMLR